MTWESYYKDRVNDASYFIYFKKKYAPFIDKIQTLLPDYMNGIGEFGCGIGTTTKVLYSLGVERSYCYDNNWDILELARQNLTGINNVFFHYWNITKKFPQPRKYDLIHSHGVLEHFDDLDIQNIFYHQTQYTDRIVHYVPSIGYDTPSFGDERLMSKEQWEEILKDYNIQTEYFNKDKDLIISWSR